MIFEFSQSQWHYLEPSDKGITKTLENGDEVTYTSEGMSTEETKLLSFMFNTFVFMQVFNQINARMLEDGEFNVFKGMCSNLPFVGIMIVTIFVQLLMVEFGGRMVKCWPFNMKQNGLCILIGSGELIWGILIKFVPTRFFFPLSLEDKSDDEGDKKKHLSLMIKGKK